MSKKDILKLDDEELEKIVNENGKRKTIKIMEFKTKGGNEYEKK